MANEAKYVEGTKLNLETSGPALSDGDFHAADNDDRQPADDAGYPLGKFEWSTATGGFSTTPTAGAVVNLYERKINSGSNDAPVPDANYKNDYIGSFVVDVDASQQHLSTVAPIHVDGGKYSVEWLDGGTGTAAVTGGWTLDLTPITYGPA